MVEVKDFQQTNGVSPVHPQLFPFRVVSFFFLDCKKMLDKTNKPSKTACRVKRSSVSVSSANEGISVGKLCQLHKNNNTTPFIVNYLQTVCGYSANTGNRFRSKINAS